LQAIASVSRIETERVRMSVLQIDRDPVNLAEIHPALRSFRDEAHAFIVRFLAYVCGLAALAAILADLLVRPVGAAIDTKPAAKPSWTTVTRPRPVFAIPQIDLSGMTEPYEVLRHPGGGRKDVLHWAPGADGKPTASIEFYRPGAEIAGFGPADSILSARIGEDRPVRAEAGGMIASKFGPVHLIRLTGDAPGTACTGFVRDFVAPRLRISGWTCQPPSAPAQRTAIACALDRLVLLSAGNDPKLAEMFAHAELNRSGCRAAPAGWTDWMTSLDDPVLRGRL
jgi:hypothetical protein